jgi:branched-subunit amino acid transport protein
MKQSSFFSLNLQDFLKGLLVAVGGAVMAIILPSLQSGNLTFDWTTIWHTAVASALAYLGKNLFTPTPKSIQIDPSKTSVVDSNTKQTIIKSN